MRFDLFTIALLTLRDDAPVLDEAAAAALQDAHMAYNAALHEAGHLLAAGPLPHERYRGLSIWSADPDRVRELREGDPAVEAGRLSAAVVRWMVPGGTIDFSPTRLPRSVAEVTSGEVALDRHTIVLLTLRPDAPVMDEAERTALQDAHLAHNAAQREAGRMLAAGPIHDDVLRGLSIWGVPPDEVEAPSQADPSVRAGRLAPLVLPWMVPAGAMSFSPGRFPRSTAEAAYE
ncbi:MAG TPA: YciI family protein [Candidatus Dormibacteraeota bacterium]|nr:YciI family protein [Candidatus Dormibacteraeota bacterium]